MLLWANVVAMVMITVENAVAVFLLDDCLASHLKIGLDLVVYWWGGLVLVREDLDDASVFSGALETRSLMSDTANVVEKDSGRGVVEGSKAWKARDPARSSSLVKFLAQQGPPISEEG